MSDYTKEDAELMLERLMCDLAMREDNYHSGSCLGGNPSEFFFLLTHRVNVIPAVGGALFTLEDGNIFLHVDPTLNLRVVREALTEFANNHPYKKTITQKLLTNIDLLKIYESGNLKISLLIKAIETANDLVSWLDPKIELSKQVARVFGKELQEVEHCFLKEIGLPETYLDDLGDTEYRLGASEAEVLESEGKTDDKYMLRSMLLNHAVWGVRYEEIESHKDSIEVMYLSQSDREKLKLIWSMPSYISLFAIRTCIGLERQIQLKLDKACANQQLYIERLLNPEDFDDEDEDDCS
jgi:hypothetical protein